MTALNHFCRRLWMLSLAVTCVAGGIVPLVYGQAVPDVSLVPPHAYAVAVAKVGDVLKHPQAELLPIEVLSAWGKRDLGLDPLDVEEVLGLAALTDEGMPALGFVIRFSKAYPFPQLFPHLVAETIQAELRGKTYRQAEYPMMSLYPLNEKTVIVAHESLLRDMLENQGQPQPGPLSKLMQSTAWRSELTIIVAVQPVRPLLQAGLRAGLTQSDLPPPFADIVQLPKLIEALKFEYSILDKQILALTILSPDAKRAEELEGLLNQWLDQGSQLLVNEMQREMARAGDADEIQQALTQYIKRIIRFGINSLRPQRQENVLVIDPFKGEVRQLGVATTGMLIGLLLPAVRSAREAARSMTCGNNLKQIGLAMHYYHDVHKQFPARANFDADGKPLLSWRVHLLPFLDAGHLYDQFHLDEPWDSEHNKKLIPLMPPVYRCPNVETPPHTTVYQLPVGKGTLFEGTTGKNLSNVLDGTSNTIMAVETSVDKAVIWTKPDDWEVDMSNPIAGLGFHHERGAHVVFVDGSVQVLATAIDPKILRALLTIAGGEVVRDF